MTDTGGSYNITWDHGASDCLTYMVRIRDNRDPSKVTCEQGHENTSERPPQPLAVVPAPDTRPNVFCLFPFSQNPVYSLKVTEKNVALDHNRLQPRVSYVVDVQARMCPGHPNRGPWSEWSSTVRWRTGGAREGGTDTSLLSCSHK